MTVKTFIKWLGIIGFIGLSIGSATTQEERLAATQQSCANRFGYQYGTAEMAQCVERQIYQQQVEQQKAGDKLTRCLNGPAIHYNKCILSP